MSLESHIQNDVDQECSIPALSIVKPKLIPLQQPILFRSTARAQTILMQTRAFADPRLDAELSSADVLIG